ncbi:SH3 domain-Hypothetical protein protein 5 (SH3BP5) [Nesidiocoris tenuis]|uniref:SH3 domain-binding protein 5-like n=1 Tax=Nesidiocoris tenuis TaxID=355587 RepID=A0ABN7B385_9HEMI|nr:SH3 domain-Hypothetical protein protein 5 (SH3BP5) [Nesidiocoris tenuis]
MLLRRCESENEQQVDPRVKVELERLNSATDDINKLEVELDEARATFHNMLRLSMVETEALCNRVGPSSVEKARPYYAARIQSKQAQAEAHKSALRLEKANSAHSAAKEMVFLAEEGLTMEGRTFDHAWQEMLNHATIRVNECETERTQSEAHNLRATAACQAAQNKVAQLQKELKKAIAKSRCYYETKAKLNARLDVQKARVIQLENLVLSAKTTYSDALKNLETISNEIHKSRRGNGKSNGKPNSPNGSSSTSSSESTGSPDSYPNEEYLRLPDRPGVSPSTPQVDYRKLCGSEETSPIETRRCNISPLERSPFESPTSVGSNYHPCSSDLSPRVPEPPAAEEWSEIPLSVDGASPRVAEAVESREPEPATPHPPIEQMGRRQSIDALISGSTGKVKEIFSQGILKLNIASISERKNSLESCRRRVSKSQRPSSRTSRCSTDEGASSNEDPQSSDEMLSDDQIASLMLDEELQFGGSSTSKMA